MIENKPLEQEEKFFPASQFPDAMFPPSYFPKLGGAPPAGGVGGIGQIMIEEMEQTEQKKRRRQWQSIIAVLSEV